MKKFLSFLLSMLMILQLGGCSMNSNGFRRSAQANEEPIQIGYASPNLNDRYQRYMEVAAREYAEKNNIEFLLADAQENVITQQDQIKKLISQGAQGLIVVPVDTRAMAPVTAMAKEAGIPLVYLNRNPYPDGNFPEGTYYVGSKESDAGVMQADFLGENLQSGNIGVLLGPENNEASQARAKGLEQELSGKYPDIKIIAKGTANWDRQQAYELVKGWLAQYGKTLNAIVGGNDEMALGAIKALKEAGRNDVIVVGIDGLEVGRKAVGEGTLAATVFQDGDVQGETAVKIVQQLVNGEKPAQQINWIPFILITSGVISNYPENITG